jgi:hypothetical protein
MSQMHTAKKIAPRTSVPMAEEIAQARGLSICARTTGPNAVRSYSHSGVQAGDDQRAPAAPAHPARVRKLKAPTKKSLVRNALTHLLQEQGKVHRSDIR